MATTTIKKQTKLKKLRTPNQKRLRIIVTGAVQGVGFRPFIYRLATELELFGWVKNSTQGVLIEVEGEHLKLEDFLYRIEREKPPRASIQSLESVYLDAAGYQDFQILESKLIGEKSAFVLPDIATCPECLSDIFNPLNRRFRYPFTNCTHCGPRFSIIRALPYDRERTSMAGFKMCQDCTQEYRDPKNRRFHAEPNACPVCGPRFELWNPEGKALAAHDRALFETVTAIRDGKIVAVKGLGGFHLMADARNGKVIQRLRTRKHREEKPFAVMFPDLESVKECCDISKTEERLLTSVESPIVILHQKSGVSELLAFEEIAPRNPYLGVMLPYTPLHHLLLRELKFPVLATSGNLSDETIVIDEREALGRLKGIADIFLVHNRPIMRHVDDSVARIAAGRELILRRARGFAPLPIVISGLTSPTLAVGGHLKNAIAQSVGNQVFVSQHIGDLETEASLNAFETVVCDFQALYDSKPKTVVCDSHPAYFSTQFAEKSKLPLVRIQHHWAHVLSCMAENELLGKTVLGVAWDGTGFSDDGTIWGGEFLIANGATYQRFAHLRSFQLPGGDTAIHEPRRSAIGLLYEIFGNQLFDLKQIKSLETFSKEDRTLLRQILEKKTHSPQTSSIGRLFDAVSSLLGLCQVHQFEGQAAMELEFALEGVHKSHRSYPFYITRCEKHALNSCLLVDWEFMIREILSEVCEGVSYQRISAKFHNTLVEMIVEIAKRAKEKHVVLTGGCFQNKYLLERAIQRLEKEGLKPYWHQRFPPNDGSIALGQIAASFLQSQNHERNA